MENIDYIRTKERLEYLKKEFNDHVIETSNAIRTIEKRSVIRNGQMDDLNSKMDDVIDTLADSKLSSRKGIITKTLDNSDKIGVIENELAAWKRAVIIVGGLMTGLIFAGRYLWVVLTQLLKKEIQ